MLLKNNSNSFIIYLAFVLVFLISNSLITFGQNPDSNSSSLNHSEDNGRPVVSPKLVGIFADNVNGSTNILIDNSNQGKLKIYIM